MNLPWDKSYFKICFYVIFTFIAIYISKNIIDVLIYALLNMGGIYRFVLRSFRTLASIFSVIIIGFIIAYILNPVVEFFERKGFKKGMSILTAFFIFIVIFLIVIVCGYVNITEFNKYSLVEGLEYKVNQLNVNLQRLKSYIDKFFNIINIEVFTNESKPNKIDILYLIGKYLSQGFIGLIISIYFLKDKENIIKSLKEYSKVLPNKINKVLNYILGRLNYVFSGYVKGQLTDAIILSGIFSVVLSLIGIPFSVPIGILSGLLNIIPYFGTIGGLLLSVTGAFLSGVYSKAIYTAIIIFIIQQIDGAYIYPRIVGQSLKLSPVAIIIALAVSANIFGILGMIIAVPMLSFFKIVIGDFVYKRNKIE